MGIFVRTAVAHSLVAHVDAVITIAIVQAGKNEQRVCKISILFLTNASAYTIISK